MTQQQIAQLICAIGGPLLIVALIFAMQVVITDWARAVVVCAVLLTPVETRSHRVRLLLVASAAAGAIVLVPSALTILVLQLDSWQESSY